MKHSFLFALLASSLSAANYYVSPNATLENGVARTHTSVDAAVDAAVAAGCAGSTTHTVWLDPAQTYTENISMKGGACGITIKTTKIDRYPRGYRITRNHPYTAKIAGKVEIATDNFGWADFASHANGVITNKPGNVTQAHNWATNDKVVVKGAQFSVVHCKTVNQTPYSTLCDSAHVGTNGLFNVKREKPTNGDKQTYFVEGMAIQFGGRGLPDPLQEGTIYYTKNVTINAFVGNLKMDSFEVALTPGGASIMDQIAAYDPVGREINLIIPPSPAAQGQELYAVSASGSTLGLSFTHGGAPITFTQAAGMYNGSIYTAGFQMLRIKPAGNIVFDGIEIAPVADYGVYSVVLISADIGNAAGEHHNIKFLRCHIHGADDQESFPMQGIYIAARDSEVAYSIVEDIYSSDNDTQAIALVSSRNMYVHDNWLSATGESIMSGGNVPWFATQTNTNQIRVERNYFYKPVKWYSTILLTRLSNTTFRFASRTGTGTCDSHAASTNLGVRCLWYEGDDKDPDNNTIARYETALNAADSTVTVTGSTAGQRGVLYGQGGVIKMDHNFSGTVGCPAGMTCAFVASPVVPPTGSRIGIAVLDTGGIFAASGNGTLFFIGARPPWVKNALESKYGDGWSVTGNVFHRQFLVEAEGNTSQSPLVQFTLAANGSSLGEMINYRVSSSDSVFRNNIFRHSPGGVNINGKTYTPSGFGIWTPYEFAGFGQAKNNRLENNFYADIGSSEWGNSWTGAVTFSNTKSLSFAHNTAVDMRYSLVASPGNTGAGFSNNVFSGYRHGIPASTNCSHTGCTNNPYDSSHPGYLNFPINTSFPTVFGAGVTAWQEAVTLLTMDATTSSWANNVLVNRNGDFNKTSRPTNYPSTTYLNVNADTGRDPELLFTNWNERVDGTQPKGDQYRDADFRLAAGKCAAYASTDSKCIGADMDEIEAWTGPYGRDVENGLPTFADRTASNLVVASTSASLSYLLTGSTCAINIWPNKAYSGTATFTAAVDTAVGATASGRLNVSLTGLSPATAYWGKRVCAGGIEILYFRTL
jgi:hypothetical protein